MKAHFFHGFNVSDGGSNSVDKLAPWFAMGGCEIVEHDYGWVGLLRLRRRNARTIQGAYPAIGQGDVLIAHSNGCLICWELVEAGAPVSAVICVQPALRRDTTWRDDVRVLCLYNPRDRIVSMGRMWSRFMSVANPFRDRHGWGAAGRHGFTADQANVDNWNTATGPVPAVGHSGLFQTRPLLHWAPKIRDWALPSQAMAA